MQPMEIYRRSLGGPEYLNDEGVTTILGPCPGCDSWQIDYTVRVATSYAGWTAERISYYEPGEDRPTHALGMPQPDISPFWAVIEEALQEHMTECPHLRDLIQEY